MIISEIKPQKQNPQRYNIYVDGEFFYAVDIDTLYELRLKAGTEIEKEAFEAMAHKLEFKKAFSLCLKWLTKSGKTERQIAGKLKEKEFDEATIDDVIDKLKSLGYLNDEKYLENWLQSKSGSSGMNKKSAYMKLRQKGIDKELIREKIEEAPIDEYASASKAAEKKLKSLKGTPKEKKAKLQNFLYNKGYEVEICHKIINAIEFEENGDENL